ncbi:MAG: hypothetical protein ABIH63_02530 [archaeon]
MNKKAQTEDIFADLIPSIMILVIGILILYYFSFNFSEEVRDNEFLTTRITDREAFSIEGMMNHQVGVDGKYQKVIDVIDQYSKTQNTADKMKYETAVETGAKEYLLQIDPQIVTCFKIKLIILLKSELDLLDMCELNIIKEVRSELAIIPLSDGTHAKIRMEYGEPDI